MLRRFVRIWGVRVRRGLGWKGKGKGGVGGRGILFGDLEGLWVGRTLCGGGGGGGREKGGGELRS